MAGRLIALTVHVTDASAARARDLTWLVALAAALWGTDALLRLPLARDVAAPTIVFAEHAVLVLVLLPFLPRAIRAFRRLDARGRIAVRADRRRRVRGGDDAVHPVVPVRRPGDPGGDPEVPAGHRDRRRRGPAARAASGPPSRGSPRPALVGAWLLAFPNPLAIGVDRAAVALLALGAAVLWAGGTVLGRLVAPQVSAVELTTLRFAFGLPAAFVIVLATGSPLWVPDVIQHALGDRYRAGARPAGDVAVLPWACAGRRRPARRWPSSPTRSPRPSSASTLLDAHLAASQWVGAALIVAAVTALSWHEARAAGAGRAGGARSSRWSESPPGRRRRATDSSSGVQRRRGLRVVAPGDPLGDPVHGRRDQRVEERRRRPGVVPSDTHCRNHMPSRMPRGPAQLLVGGRERCGVGVRAELDDLALLVLEVFERPRP